MFCYLNSPVEWRGNNSSQVTLGEMILQDIYKIPITKMNLESGAVCMIHPSQIIKNQVLPESSSKFILSIRRVQ